MDLYVYVAGYYNLADRGEGEFYNLGSVSCLSDGGSYIYNTASGDCWERLNLNGSVEQFGAIPEVDPGFGTRGLIGKSAVPLLNGADHDEANETDD
jgi:hypothetical protein